MMLKLGLAVAMTVILLLMVTQVFVPVMRGTPLFPILRRQRALRAQLAHAREDVGNATIERKLTELHDQADDIRNPPESTEPEVANDAAFEDTDDSDNDTPPS